MKTIQTQTDPFTLTVLFAPGRTLQPGVKNQRPLSPTFFVGWGGIRGFTEWPDVDPAKPATKKARDNLMRGMIAGVANLRAMAKGETRIVIGCEHAGRWKREKPSRSTEIDTLIKGIYYDVKRVYGPGVEMGFSGQEDELAGDFQAPMLGPTSRFEKSWNDRNPIPFLSIDYHSTPEHDAVLLVEIDRGPGLGKRGAELWIQRYDAAGQKLSFEYADRTMELFRRLRGTT